MAYLHEKTEIKMGLACQIPVPPLENEVESDCPSMESSGQKEESSKITVYDH